jgi:hypothetical protein
MDHGMYGLTQVVVSSDLLWLVLAREPDQVGLLINRAKVLA